MKGTIHDKKTLFLRVAVGTAETKENGTPIKYEMSLVNGSVPAVKSEQTGKYYLLSWQDIIDLAIESGIDAE